MIAWLVRVFAASAVRKLAYVLVALAFALCFGHRAHATAEQWTIGVSGWAGATGTNPYALLPQAIAYVNANAVAIGGSTMCGPSNLPCTATGSLSAGTWPTYTCTLTLSNATGLNGSPIHPACTLSAAAAATQPNACPAAGQGTLFGLAAISADGKQCFNGCQFSQPGQGLIVSCGPGNQSGCTGGQGLVQASSTGLVCSSSAATTPTAATGSPSLTPVTNDASGVLGSATDPRTGQFCGTVNGDEVCLAAIQNGTCVAYSSGGVACAESLGTSQTAPPAPAVTGTTPATADVVVTGDGQTLNYYSPPTVAAGASHGNPTNPINGQPIGSTGTGTGIGTCVPSAPGVTPVVVCTGSSGSGSGSGGSGSDSESGGTDCVTPPSCDGDAIQCGIVQQEWLNRCATTNQADIASAVSLGDGEAVSASTVDQSTALSETGYFSTGVGTCPGGSSLTMFGNTLSYNFLTALCSFALKIQGIVMVVGYLIGISIWVRGLVA